ncbi:UNVERIFIED_CONTAM: hypothetical protein Slati_3483200 [Sesamum latifolium]|uniref:DUF4283 domain-containing protein n=1 Tax=Sesamum latifolium TaxID=2727402 RepID=A0AAW2UIA7_9LAMI
MESDLSRLGHSLVLTEHEDLGEVMPTGVWHSDSDSGGFHTVGCVLSHKPYHTEALRTILKSSLNPAKGMEISFIENNRFLLKLFHAVDRDRVLASGPWAFEKNLIVLAPVSADDNPTEVDLSWCDFHVRIHGLPLGKMTPEIASFIGAFAPSAEIMNGVGDEHIVTFTYERLPNYCYLCGRIGHILKWLSTELINVLSSRLRALFNLIRSCFVPDSAHVSLCIAFLNLSRRGSAIFGDFPNMAAPSDSASPMPDIHPPAPSPQSVPTIVTLSHPSATPAVSVTTSAVSVTTMNIHVPCPESLLTQPIQSFLTQLIATNIPPKRKYTKKTRSITETISSSHPRLPSKRKLVDRDPHHPSPTTPQKLIRLAEPLSDISNLTAEAASQPHQMP